MNVKKSLFVFAILALAPSAAMAVLVTEFAFTVGEVSSSSAINLTYENVDPSNPAFPLDFSDMPFDTSTYSGDGSVLTTELKISGFDGPEVVTLELDCTRWEDSFVGFPVAAMLCDVTSATSSGGIPKLFGSELDFTGTASIVMTENGVDLDDATGEPTLKFETSASGTATEGIPVAEPSSALSALIGFFALLGTRIFRG